VATVILLDTHVVVWLYGGENGHLPQAVRARLNREELAVSPFGRLELDYLHEIRRARAPAQVVLDDLKARMGLEISDVSAAEVCAAATQLTWTRDPFDRLLAAHATVANLPLITRDATMLEHLPLAWWAG
jgi:PIN domain nuclease of toxin-antitoxin system